MERESRYREEARKFGIKGRWAPVKYVRLRLRGFSQISALSRAKH